MKFDEIDKKFNFLNFKKHGLPKNIGKNRASYKKLMKGIPCDFEQVNVLY